MIKENFSFKWIKINFKTVIYLIIDFIFVSIVFIPFLMQFYNAKLSFILGHALLTGFLVVLTFYFIGYKHMIVKSDLDIISLPSW
mgnify:CR=1 FL=1